MALKNFKPQFETITAGDEPVPVYGLTVQDIGYLMRDYGESCRNAYELFQATEGSGDIATRLDRALVDLVHLVPDLAAAIIALAAREPDAVDEAKSLPFTVQVDALVKVFNLTLGSEGGLGNFLAVLRNATSGLTKAAASLKAPLAPGAIQ